MPNTKTPATKTSIPRHLFKSSFISQNFIMNKTSLLIEAFLLLIIFKIYFNLH